MSFSFMIKAASKAEAKTAIAFELSKVAQAQPIHELDRGHIQQVAELYVDAFPAIALPEGRDLCVTVNGSLGWRGTYPTDYTMSSMNVGVGLYTAPRATVPHAA